MTEKLIHAIYSHLGIPIIRNEGIGRRARFIAVPGWFLSRMCKRDAEKQSSTNFIRRIVHEMHEFYGLFLGILQELHHVTLFVTDLVHCKPLTTNVGVKGLNSLATDEIAFHW